MRATDIPSSYRLVFQVAFEHMFFADGVLRAMRIVPVGACHDMLRRAGVLLRPLADGIGAYGDEEAFQRLRLHIAEAGGPLAMAFQVFFTDPHFHEYTVPGWPQGHLLFLDTARCTTDDNGRQMLHATPCVTAAAFLARDHVDLMRILGQRVLAPRPDMVLQVDVSHRLLDTAVPAQRQFHARFDAARSHWQYCLPGGVDGAADQAPAFAMAHAGMGRRCRDNRDGDALLVPESLFGH
jgi:hypothetical protein